MVVNSAATVGYSNMLPSQQFPYIKCHSRIWHHVARSAVPNVLKVHHVPLWDMVPCCHVSSSQCSDSTSRATLGYGTVLPREPFPVFWQYITCHSEIWYRVATWAAPSVLTVHQVPLIQHHTAISQTWILGNSIVTTSNLIFFVILHHFHFPDFILTSVCHLIRVATSKVKNFTVMLVFEARSKYPTNTYSTEHKYKITHQCVSEGDSSYASQALGASEYHLLPSWSTKRGTWTMAYTSWDISPS